MIHLLAFGNDSTIALPEDSQLGDTHQRQRHYASILKSYHYITLAPTSIPLAKQQIDTNFWVYPSSRSMLSYLPRSYQIANQIMKNQTVDLVSAQDPFIIGLTAYLISRRHKRPLSLQFAADMVNNPYWVNQRPLNRLLNSLGKWVIQRANSFRVVSQKEEAKLQAMGVSPTQIANLGWITDFSRFQKAEKPPNRSVFLPNTHKKLLLFVGRLAPQKNLDMMLRAFSKINKAHPDSYLLLAGDGPLKAELLELANTLGIQDSVRFEGMVPYEKIPSYFAAADLFVLSSIYEGNARVLAEAAATGLTAVSTDVSGASDTIINGETGYVTPIGQIDPFVDRVCHLLANPSLNQAMGTKAQAHILNLYDTTHLLDGFNKFWFRSAFPKTPFPTKTKSLS